tara:strand:- start:79 stop:915 length:837 start_codon:yes stop_codon:yes gene_type:complete
MNLSKTDKENFYSKGYIHIKNFLDNKAIEELKSSATKKSNIESQGKRYSIIEDLNVRSYLGNNSLINVIKVLLGSKSYFLHDASILDMKYPYNNVTWHRDNPCRKTNVGPDWDGNLNYNVVTTLLYLRSSNETSTGLSLIPASHKKNFSQNIKNYLRFFHSSTRSVNLTRPIRKGIENIIGKEIHYEAGDLVIFLSNLYHSAITIGDFSKYNRQAIVARFGGEGFHSINYINYVLNLRDDMNIYDKSIYKNDFFNFLKSKNLFIEPPKEKYHIKGAYY